MLVFNTLLLETYLYPTRSAHDGPFQAAITLCVNVLFDRHNLYKAAPKIAVFRGIPCFRRFRDDTAIRNVYFT